MNKASIRPSRIRIIRRSGGCSDRLEHANTISSGESPVGGVGTARESILRLHPRSAGLTQPWSFEHVDNLPQELLPRMPSRSFLKVWSKSLTTVDVGMFLRLARHALAITGALQLYMTWLVILEPRRRRLFIACSMIRVFQSELAQSKLSSFMLRGVRVALVGIWSRFKCCSTQQGTCRISEAT